MFYEENLHQPNNGYRARDYTTVERQHNALKGFLQIQLWIVPHPDAYKYRVIHARDQT